MSGGHGIEAVVDRAQCIGNGVCVAIAPRAFALDDDHRATTIDPSEELAEALYEAARQCPVQAIYLSRHGRPIDHHDVRPALGGHLST